MTSRKRLYSQLKKTKHIYCHTRPKQQNLWELVSGWKKLLQIITDVRLPSAFLLLDWKVATPHLAPPWNLMLVLPTAATQSAALTTGRPVSSLLATTLVVMVSPFTLRSKEPWSFLSTEKSHCCRHRLTTERSGLSRSHYSEVLDPPVAVQTDEGVPDWQTCSGCWHKVHGGLWQPHVGDSHTGRNNVHVKTLWRRDKPHGLTWTSCTGRCRSEPLSASLKYPGLWWSPVSAGSGSPPAVRLTEDRSMREQQRSGALWVKVCGPAPYSRPFSDIWTCTPGLVPDVTWVTATRAKKQRRSIVSSWKRRRRSHLRSTTG